MKQAWDEFYYTQSLQYKNYVITQGIGTDYDGYNGVTIYKIENEDNLKELLHLHFDNNIKEPLTIERLKEYIEGQMEGGKDE